MHGNYTQIEIGKLGRPSGHKDLSIVVVGQRIFGIILLEKPNNWNVVLAKQQTDVKTCVHVVQNGRNARKNVRGRPLSQFSTRNSLTSSASYKRTMIFMLDAQHYSRIRKIFYDHTVRITYPFIHVRSSRWILITFDISALVFYHDVSHQL